MVPELEAEDKAWLPSSPDPIPVFLKRKQIDLQNPACMTMLSSLVCPSMHLERKRKKMVL